MALPVTGVYEIRATATAGNVNGGGFNSARGGTDYTLQDAAQLTGTDGSAAGGTTFTSVTGGFTTAMAGNYIHITASTGLTVGWYEIVSRTDTNNVVLDRSPGTGTGSTYYVGGAMSLNSTLDDDLFETAVATNGAGANKFWIKNGSYSFGETVSIAAAGGTQAPIVIEGYNTTRGDTPTGDSRPSINLGANGFTLGGYFWLFNVKVTGTASVLITMGTGSKIFNCKAVNTSTTASRSGITLTTGVVINNEFISYRGNGINNASGSGVLVFGSWSHDSNNGFNGVLPSLVNNIFSSNVNAALNTSTAITTGIIVCNGNTLYGAENKQGTGLNLFTTSTNAAALFANNIFYGFATAFTSTDVQTSVLSNYNNYYNNTTDVSNITKGANDIAIDPAFASMGQVVGTAGAFTAGNDRLVDTSKNFTSLGVVAGRDYLLIKSGTGATANTMYGISSITTTTNANDTLVLDVAPGTSTTADKVYQITTGQNFLPTGSI